MDRRGRGDAAHRGAGDRRRHRTIGFPMPTPARSSAAPCCRPRSTPSSSSTRAAIIEFNPAAEKMFGWTSAATSSARTARHRRSGLLSQGYARAPNTCRAAARRWSAADRDLTQNAAGEVFPIELTATEMRVADRRLIFGSMRDLRANAPGRERDQPPARKAASEREDGGDGLAAGRRFARTQQSARRGGRPIDFVARVRFRSRRPRCAPKRCAPRRSAAAASSRASSRWCACIRRRRPRPTSTRWSVRRSK